MISSVITLQTSQLRATLWHPAAPHAPPTCIVTPCRQWLTRSVEPPRLRGLSVTPDPPPDTRLLPSSDGVTSLFRPLWFAVSLANSLRACRTSQQPASQQATLPNSSQACQAAWPWPPA